MHLTDTEAAIVRELRRKRVATMRLLCEQFRVSHMTVVRALNKPGYYSSYNLNAAYYTLQDTPQFDEHGLWSYRNVRFSRFGSLPETIVQLRIFTASVLQIGFSIDGRVDFVDDGHCQLALDRRRLYFIAVLFKSKANGIGNDDTDTNPNNQ